MKLRELYKFVEGDTVFTQTPEASAITYAAEVYTPYAIGRSEAESKNELQRANVDVSMDLDNPIAVRYLTNPVDAVVSLTIFRQEIDDADVLQSGAFWKGRLRSVMATKNEVKLTFESFFTSLRRPGLRARYQKACRHGVYARGCYLDPEDFRVEATALSHAGNVIVVDSIGALADGRLRGGMLRAPDNIVRFITGHSGTTLTLLRNFGTLNDAIDDTPGGAPVVLYPGCAHNPAACLEFDNLDNYGGFPWIPDINLFAGNSVA